MVVRVEESIEQETAEAVRAAETWLAGLEAIAERIGPRFVRGEARSRAKLYLMGLVSQVERKNGWQMAETAGDETPHGVQNLLGRAAWSADEVRDDLVRYVLEHLTDKSGVLVIDETGFLKKGDKSVGVQRQYSGTAGKIENCQIGVFLTYLGPKGRTLVDRELYLPEVWAEDFQRRQEAAIPETIEFATKPRLAKRMLGRAFEAGFKPEWVLGDEVYGDNRDLRIWLQQRSQPYVLAVSGKEYVWQGVHQHRVSKVLAGLGQTGWERLSAGEGAKGERLYDWTLLELNHPLSEGFGCWLLVRRSIEDGKLQAYVVYALRQTPLRQMVTAAGSRWSIEECFQSAKGEVGLDQYEVRSWHGWYRHITLAMLAHAYLTVTRASAQAAEVKKGGLKIPKKGSLEEFKRRRRR